MKTKTTKTPVERLLGTKMMRHWERSLRLRGWRFYWQWRSTRQLGWIAGEFPHPGELTVGTQIDYGFAAYLWHFVFFAAKEDGTAHSIAFY